MERTTLGAILRTSQAFCSQLCEKETLNHGIAYYCPRYPVLPEANQFREIIAEDSSKVENALRESDAWFTSKDIRCLAWSPAEGVTADTWEPLLARQGFRRREFVGWALSKWTPVPVDSDIRILPARAMRAALAELISLESPGEAADTAKTRWQAMSDRLDVPQFDLFIAMAGARPVGRCALYQVGDIARIMEFVRVPGSPKESGPSLLAHVLALARRLTMRNVVAQVDAHSSDLSPLFESAGFIRNAQFVEFHRGQSP